MSKLKIFLIKERYLMNQYFTSPQYALDNTTSSNRSKKGIESENKKNDQIDKSHDKKKHHHEKPAQDKHNNHSPKNR
ncbi:MAG: hypothetical protein ABI597_07400 [Gammaproteobacteria bacterium]